jgi:tetratricopeptide (TPR) repeat protein
MAAPALAADPPAPPQPTEQTEKSSANLAEELFARLAKTEDADEAAGIVAALQSLWLHSGSDASDLLMARAQAALGHEDYSLAISLLDAVVIADPDWAEGWNARATARFYAGDAEGSAADVAQTLKRNPRHLGALSGLAAIFEQAGQKENALKVYQRALALAPNYKPLRDSAARLKHELEGQAL